MGAALAEDDLECNLTVRVRHPLEVLIHDVGIERIAAEQTYSISEFRPACYYGCQIVRPQRAFEEDPEVPMAMDELFAALGAEPVDYPPKVRCCGGMLVVTAEEVADRLCDELIGWARDRGANCIVTVCPLCQGNLDILGRDLRRALAPDLQVRLPQRHAGLHVEQPGLPRLHPDQLLHPRPMGRRERPVRQQVGDLQEVLQVLQRFLEVFEIDPRQADRTLAVQEDGELEAVVVLGGGSQCQGLVAARNLRQTPVEVDRRGAPHREQGAGPGGVEEESVASVAELGIRAGPGEVSAQVTAKGHG